MDWSNYRAPSRASRAELLRALHTIPGARFRVQGENTAYVLCDSIAIAQESQLNVLTAAGIKGFRVTLSGYDGEGYLLTTESRNAP